MAIHVLALLSMCASCTCTAHAAIANLNGVTLYGKKIHVTLSKHATVQMPQAGSNVSLGNLGGVLGTCFNL